jgi:hypothetical protein
VSVSVKCHKLRAAYQFSRRSKASKRRHVRSVVTTAKPLRNAENTLRSKHPKIHNYQSWKIE